MIAMRIHRTGTERGIALIIVMVTIFTLSVLAGAFAYSMKIEMRLARNHGSETELEWLGRSGVELARYLVSQQVLSSPSVRYHALNQKWAGGTGVTNDIFADIHLEDNELGAGVFSIEIVDQERKFNINVADEPVLRQTMNLLGVDSVEASSVVAAIMDWRDPDNDPHVNGTESSYYRHLTPPYYAKNGPIDDLSELLLIKGITPEMYWGRGSPKLDQEFLQAERRTRLGTHTTAAENAISEGMADLFTCVANRQININTAPSAVLQLLPAIDANIASAIIRQRSGLDGVEGNEDDTPFHQVGELVNVPGLSRQMVAMMTRYVAVQSATFEVTVDAHIGTYRREYVALLRLNNPRDVQVLNFHWK